MERTTGAWIIVVLFLTLISVDVRSVARSDIEETQSFSALTDSIRFELNASAGMSKVRMLVTATVESGEVSWVLTDPDGKTRLIGEGTGGEVRTGTGNLKPIEGTWILKMDFENATGRYRFSWHGR